MNGIPITELSKIHQVVNRWHSFGRMPSEVIKEEMRNHNCVEEILRFGMNIKYVDTCMDSRFGDVWSIGFRGIGNDVTFTTNDKVEGYTDLLELVKDYLTGHYKPSKE